MDANYLTLRDAIIHLYVNFGIAEEEARTKILGFIKNDLLLPLIDFKGYAIVSQKLNKLKTPYKDYYQSFYIVGYLYNSDLHKVFKGKSTLEYIDCSISKIYELTLCQPLETRFTPSNLPKIHGYSLTKNNLVNISPNEPLVNNEIIGFADKQYLVAYNDYYIDKVKLYELFGGKAHRLPNDFELDKSDIINSSSSHQDNKEHEKIKDLNNKIEILNKKVEELTSINKILNEKCNQKSSPKNNSSSRNQDDKVITMLALLLSRESRTWLNGEKPNAKQIGKSISDLADKVMHIEDKYGVKSAQRIRTAFNNSLELFVKFKEVEKIKVDEL